MIDKKMESLKLELNYYTPPELIEWAARFSWLSHHLQTENTHKDFLKNLIKLGHKSPLDCSLVVFSIHGVDRAVTHQIVRHKLGFSQESQRYVKQSQTEFYDHPDLKDRVIETLEMPNSMTIDSYYNLGKQLYIGLLKQGVSKEVARRVLPNAATCSMALWGSIRGIMDFCVARMSPEAETPVRTIAASMFDTMKCMYPWIFDNEKFNLVREKAKDLHPIIFEDKPFQEYRGLRHKKKFKDK